MKPWQSLRVAWRGDRDRWLLGAAALALAACLFNPGVTLQRSRYEHVIVLDITQSMNVADMQQDGQPVSRLIYAKQALRQSLLQLPCGSKIGWAIFTEHRSFLLSAPIEICANLSELRATLARIDTRMAWSGNSEIAKGVHSAKAIAKELPGRPSIVFVTDGHEAPPLDARQRPAFDDKPGDVPGLIVGVGGVLPVPIPKSDPQGRPLGFWRADEVLQTDPYRAASGAGTAGQAMPQDSAQATAQATAPATASALGATPGVEHLSALREEYLRLLAREQGLAFLRLQTPSELAAALQASAMAKPLPWRSDARVALGALALCALLVRYGLAWLRRLRAAAATRLRRILQ